VRNSKMRPSFYKKIQLLNNYNVYVYHNILYCNWLCYELYLVNFRMHNVYMNSFRVLRDEIFNDIFIINLL
jgi:hypothetical protein